MGLDQAEALYLLQSILDDDATQEDASQEATATEKKRTPNASHTRHLEKWKIVLQTFGHSSSPLKYSSK